jgi:hypothetical protein
MPFTPDDLGQPADSGALSGFCRRELMVEEQNHEEKQGGKRNRPPGEDMPPGRVLARAKLAPLNQGFDQLDHAHLDATRALLPEGGRGAQNRSG